MGRLSWVIQVSPKSHETEARGSKWQKKEKEVTKGLDFGITYFEDGRRSWK